MYIILELAFSLCKHFYQRLHGACKATTTSQMHKALSGLWHTRVHSDEYATGGVQFDLTALKEELLGLLA